MIIKRVVQIMQTRDGLRAIFRNEQGGRRHVPVLCLALVESWPDRYDSLPSSIPDSVRRQWVIGVSPESLHDGVIHDIKEQDGFLSYSRTGLD